MSNFQDNFHREEEKLLDYDDSAFYYFFISILTVIQIPFTYHILKTMIVGEKQIDLKGVNPESDRFKEIYAKRSKVYKKTWMRPGFYFKIVCCLLIWGLWYMTADQISKIKPLKSFDPYQILGVEVGSDTATVKRAYRKLSLIKHPDKNPDDPLAVSEFIQITKAYAVSKA
jgi:translocation protein SEC63